jgi:hypothetical protein|tara:strand:+ start:839 stop:1021 length:183 start_codon:yes stop_codon:yes gene_type:complete
MSAIEVRMLELIKPIDEALLMCDSREEVLMLASIMMVRLKTMFDSQLGVEGRKTMFKDYV